MSHLDRLSQWEREVSTAFPHLSCPQLQGLVIWSAGIALSGCAGIVQISALLALVLGQGEQAVFQRLREWYLDAEQKSGKKRRELDVTTCFAPLLRWALRLWKSETKQVALVIDATTLGNRWTILAISVVGERLCHSRSVEGFASRAEGVMASVLGRIAHVLARGGAVRVAGAGAGRPRLVCALAVGDHPGLWPASVFAAQSGREGTPGGEPTFEWISRWMPTPGTSWQGEVECFAGKSSRVKGTLLMHWEAGYESAWVILTDLKPEEALVSWYGLRTWIEGGFKDFKRGLWGWHHSKMHHASNVERLWLAMAVAQLWCVSLGCQAEVRQEELFRQNPPGAALPAQHIACKRRKRSLTLPRFSGVLKCEN